MDPSAGLCLPMSSIISTYPSTKEVDITMELLALIASEDISEAIKASSTMVRSNAQRSPLCRGCLISAHVVLYLLTCV